MGTGEGVLSTGEGAPVAGPSNLRLSRLGPLPMAVTRTVKSPAGHSVMSSSLICQLYQSPFPEKAIVPTDTPLILMSHGRSEPVASPFA